MNLEDLSIPESVLLLALHDATGERIGDYHDHVAAGGALAELVFRGALRETPERKGRYALVDDTATGNSFLDKSLRVVKRTGVDAKPSELIDSMVATSPAKGVIAQLAARGAVTRRQKSFLFFRWDVHPQTDPSWESALKARLSDALFRSGEIAPRDAVIIALASHAGVLHANFDRTLLHEYRDRIKSVSKGENLSVMATREAIDRAQAAAVMIALIPAFAS